MYFQQVEQQPDDPNQAYNIATTALVDLGATTEQPHDSTSILYEQQVQQADLASSMINLQNAEGTVVGEAAGITQIPISAFLAPVENIETSIQNNPGIVRIQTHPTDSKKAQYVAIQKPAKTFEKDKGTKNITSYLMNTASVKQAPKMSTLNEIFVWNKGRGLIPGETVTQVQVPIIENGVSRMTECSIVFDRFIQDKIIDAIPKASQTRLGNSNERFEEVQTVEGLDDMDFEVYMDHSTGDAPTVVTYKRKKQRKFVGRTSKTGRQMDNYKWRDTRVVDQVARELQKSILPGMVKGSPAIAKYFQAMNIPMTEIEAETEVYKEQLEEKSDNTDGLVEHTGMHVAGTVPQSQQKNEQDSVVVENAESTAVYEANDELVVTDAVNALVEASSAEQIEITEEQQMDVQTSSNVECIVIPPLKAHDQDIVTAEVKDHEASEAQMPEGDVEMSAQMYDLSKEDIMKNASTSKHITSFSKDLQKFVKGVQSEVNEKLKESDPDSISNFVDMAIKLDGTTDETTESETEVNQANVRKSNRLQIKKEKRAVQHKDVATSTVVGKLKSNNEVVFEKSIGSQTPYAPEEIESPGKKYGYFRSLCNRKLPPGTILKEHLESHRIAKKKTNSVGGSGDANITKIIATPNKVFLYYCSLCNKMYPSEDELKEHCKQHKMANEHSNEMKGEENMDDSDVEFEAIEVIESEATNPTRRPPRISHYHNRKYTKRKLMACDVCGKTTLSHAAMKIHMKVHMSSEKDLTHHKCPRGCGQRFKTEMEVDLHGPFCLRNKDGLNVKQGGEQENEDGEAACPHCHKIYDSKTMLRPHSLVCRDRPWEKCSMCDFTCKGTLPMSRHKVKEHNLKPFKCDICAKTFRLKGSLRDHTTSNHSENKFVCEHCGKKFSKLNVYKRHVFVQHGGFRYPCNYCHKKFKDKRCWRIHENSHKGAYEYSCLPCKRSFSKAPDYKHHMLTVHNIESKEALELNKAAKDIREKLCKLTCSICREKFPLESAFLHHLKAKHMLSEEAALDEYRRVSGNDVDIFEEEFEKLQKGQPIGNE